MSESASRRNAEQLVRKVNVTNPHRYRYLLLMVLTLILAFNFVDRLALGLVAQNIKIDLALSDTQLGLSDGLAFAFLYATLGIPIARYSDRGNRVVVIWLTTALWSVAVALCGSVTTFTQLVLLRVVVGIGEAGCVPPANSLICDYFSRAERPRALSIYMQGVPASLLLGYWAAGWVNEFYGWRMMFVGIGLPGVLLALLAWGFLREPRCDSSSEVESAPMHPPLIEVLRTLWRISTYRQLLYTFSMLYFFSYGAAQWIPAYFERSFGMRSGELGTWLAVVYGVSSVLGTYLFGEWATRRAASNEALQLKGAAVLLCVSTVLGCFVFIPLFAPSYYWAMLWLGLWSITQMISGPAFAVIQTLVPEHMRATAIAFIYLFANLIGLGLGPWATGMLSDLLHPWAGQESLRYALLALVPGTVWVAAHLLRAGRSVMSDLLATKRAAAGAASRDVVRLTVSDTGKQ